MTHYIDVNVPNMFYADQLKMSIIQNMLFWIIILFVTKTFYPTSYDNGNNQCEKGIKFAKNKHSQLENLSQDIKSVARFQRA